MTWLSKGSCAGKNKYEDNKSTAKHGIESGLFVDKMLALSQVAGLSQCINEYKYNVCRLLIYISVRLKTITKLHCYYYYYYYFIIIIFIIIIFIIIIFIIIRLPR